MHKVMEVKFQFDFISFSHMYRYFNTKANSISKDVIALQEGTLVIQEFKVEVASPKTILPLL